MNSEQCQQVTELLVQAVATLAQSLPIPPEDESLVVQLSPNLPWRAYVYADGTVGVRTFNESNVPITLARFNYLTSEIEQPLSS